MSAWGSPGSLSGDGSYGRGNTFEVGKSQLASGCAEGQIIPDTQELLSDAAYSGQ